MRFALGTSTRAALFCVGLVLAVALVPELARAAACTPGTDCYKDCVYQVSPSPACTAKYPGITYDAALAILVADFEEITLYDGAGSGTAGRTGPSSCNAGSGDAANCYGNTSAPFWGPAYDASGTADPTIRRGNNSAWVKLYGNGESDCIRNTGTPATPRLGYTCDVAGLGASQCQETLEYCSTAQGNQVDGGGADCWQANDRACIDVFRAGEWDDEVPSLPELDPPDGKQSLALRNVTTIGDNGGFANSVTFSAKTTLGITMFYGISGNAFTGTTVTNAQWKGDEFGGSGELMFPTGATHSNCSDDEKPFCVTYFTDGTASDPNCASWIAGAVENTGHVTCSSGGLSIQGNPGKQGGQTQGRTYNRATDFALDTVHGVKGYITGIGTSNMSWKIWYDGDGASDVILDITNLDGRHVLNAGGPTGFRWDNYSNVKTSTAIDSAVRRMYDNVHIRNGFPVPLSQIGFGAAPSDPTISLSTPTLSPTVTAGGNASAQTFTVTNTGAGTLSYAVTEGISWLSVSPSSGTSTGEADTIDVTYSTAALSPGGYSGSISVADAAATNTPQTVTVNLTVNAATTAGTVCMCSCRHGIDAGCP